MSDNAWLAIEAEAVKKRAVQEGISPEHAEEFKELFLSRVQPGIPVWMTERALLWHKLQAKRESEIDGLTSKLALRYRLPEPVVEEVIKKGLIRLRKNRKLIVRHVEEKYHKRLEKMSQDVYKTKRASSSQLASELLRMEKL